MQIKEILDLFLHLNKHLETFTNQHGTLIYILLFAIIFCETGLVILPFLPGDSLLFAIGAIAANENSGLNIWLAATILLLAAILGDTVNYLIGRTASQWMLQRFPKLIKQQHIDKTASFFNKYGGKTIILARFIPIVRTFAPFVAGSSKMNYQKFMSFNIIGAILWIGLILPAGWLLGNIPFFKNNFELVVLAIIAISTLPMLIEISREFLRKHNTNSPT